MTQVDQNIVNFVADFITDDTEIFAEASTLTRRNFLGKSGVGVASLATGGLPGLLKAALGNAANPYLASIDAYKSLPAETKKTVHNFEIWLFNNIDPNRIRDINNINPTWRNSATRGGHQDDWKIINGVVYTEQGQFPISACIGRGFTEISDLDDPFDWLNMWLSGANPEMWNKFDENLISNVVETALKKWGPRAVIENLQYIGEGGDTVFQVLTAALQNNTFSNITGITPLDVEQAQISPRKLKELVDKDLISQEYAGDYSMRRKPQREREQREREQRRELEQKQQREAEQREAEQREATEQSGEYFGSMHQDYSLYESICKLSGEIDLLLSIKCNARQTSYASFL
jgi:hypothetical protein